MLDALEGIHRAGFLHRDVKPANFALARSAPGPSAPGAWRALDFGLARRYVGDGGEVLPAREGGEFRGSSTYASVQAHLKQDLGAPPTNPCRAYRSTWSCGRTWVRSTLTLTGHLVLP